MKDATKATADLRQHFEHDFDFAPERVKPNQFQWTQVEIGPQQNPTSLAVHNPNKADEACGRRPKKNALIIQTSTTYLRN